MHTPLQEKQQELFTLLGCFHSFDLVLNPDSSWAHPSCAHHAETEAARTRSVITLPLIQRKAKYVIFHVHQSPPFLHMLLFLCLHFLPFPHIPSCPGVRMPRPALLGAVAPPTSVVPPSSLPQAQFSPRLGTNLCHLLQLDLQFGYDLAHALLSQDVLFSPGFVLPGVHSSMFCVISDQLHWPFFPSSPFPAALSSLSLVWSCPVVPGTGR